jgi:hypothetical protein
VSALTELVATWRKRAATWHVSSQYSLMRAVDMCADELESALAAERARVVITPQMFRAALVASWNPDERIYDDAAAIAHLNAALTAAPRGTTTAGF